MEKVLSSEKLFFFQVLMDYLFYRETSTPDNIDEARVLELTQPHGLGAIFFEQTKNPIFAKDYLIISSVNIIREYLMSEIKEQLEGIDYFIVSEFESAKYYPNSTCRGMESVHLIVHKKDEKRVREILFANEFSIYPKKRKQIFRKKSLIVEIHNNLNYHLSSDVKDTQKFLNECWNYCANHELDKNYYFLYLIIRLKKQILQKKISFQNFFDISCIVKNENLDWNWIIQHAKQTDLFEYMVNILSFCAEWMDIEMPSCIDYEMEDIIEQTNQMFACAKETTDMSDIVNFEKEGQCSMRIGDFISNWLSQYSFGSKLIHLHNTFMGI